MRIAKSAPWCLPRSAPEPWKPPFTTRGFVSTSAMPRLRKRSGESLRNPKRSFRVRIRTNKSISPLRRERSPAHLRATPGRFDLGPFRLGRAGHRKGNGGCPHASGSARLSLASDRTSTGPFGEYGSLERSFGRRRTRHGRGASCILRCDRSPYRFRCAKGWEMWIPSSHFPANLSR